MDLASILDLQPHGPDTYVGVGPTYPWGGLYGGQIVAQGLRAAAATVDDDFHVHSLHAYFIRRGDQSEPVRYEVERLRNGRSFTTRAVVARQAVGAILHLSASFQRDETEADVQMATMPDVPAVDDLVEDSWSPVFERRVVPHRDRGRELSWARLSDTHADAPLLQAAGLAYISDDFPTAAAVRAHPSRPGDRALAEGAFMSASLDHAIWFHRPTQVDEWHLFDSRCVGLRGARGLVTTEVFHREGHHVATVAQEVLLRPSRG